MLKFNFVIFKAYIDGISGRIESKSSKPFPCSASVLCWEHNNSWIIGKRTKWVNKGEILDFGKPKFVGLNNIAAVNRLSQFHMDMVVITRTINGKFWIKFISQPNNECTPPLKLNPNIWFQRAPQPNQPITKQTNKWIFFNEEEFY